MTQSRNYYEDALQALHDHDFEKAIAYCSTEITLDPLNAQAYKLRGKCYLYEENWLLAKKDFESLMSVDDYYDCSEIYCFLGKCHKGLNNFAKAIEYFSDSITYCTRSSSLLDVSSAYYNRGLIYQLLHNHAQAIDDFHTAMRLIPTSLTAKKAQCALTELSHRTIQGVFHTLQPNKLPESQLGILKKFTEHGKISQKKPWYLFWKPSMAQQLMKFSADLREPLLDKTDTVRERGRATISAGRGMTD